MQIIKTMCYNENTKGFLNGERLKATDAKQICTVKLCTTETKCWKELEPMKLKMAVNQQH